MREKKLHVKQKAERMQSEWQTHERAKRNGFINSFVYETHAPQQTASMQQFMSRLCRFRNTIALFTRSTLPSQRDKVANSSANY